MWRNGFQFVLHVLDRTYNIIYIKESQFITIIKDIFIFLTARGMSAHDSDEELKQQ